MHLQAILNQVDAIEDAINKGEFKTISALDEWEEYNSPLQQAIRSRGGYL